MIPFAEIGSLEDYVANDQNWQQVIGPNGNVLILPSGLQTSDKGPVGLSIGGQNGARIPYQYQDWSDCLDDADTSCACVFHDANTKLVLPVYSGFFSGGNCCAQLTPDKNSPGGAPCQDVIDGLVGQRLDRAFIGSTPLFPQWYLDLLPPEQIALGLIPDWWTCMCAPPAVVMIPDWPAPGPFASCAAPDTEYVNGRCPAGFFADPALPGCCRPLDPPVPVGVHNLAGATRLSFAAPAELLPRRRALARTRFERSVYRDAPPPPLPLLAMQPLPPGNCGCALPNSDEIEIEQ